MLTCVWQWHKQGNGRLQRWSYDGEADAVRHSSQISSKRVSTRCLACQRPITLHHITCALREPCSGVGQLMLPDVWRIMGVPSSGVARKDLTWIRSWTVNPPQQLSWSALPRLAQVPNNLFLCQVAVSAWSARTGVLSGTPQSPSRYETRKFSSTLFVPK